jgi:RNA-directed DNA polymerase
MLSLLFPALLTNCGHARCLSHVGTEGNRIKEKVGEHLKPGNVAPWEEVRDQLNQKLRGWKAYFGLGSPARAYEVLDEHVEERVRHFLRRRHKVQSQGTRQFSMKRIFGELGVFRFRGPPREARS